MEKKKKKKQEKKKKKEKRTPSFLRTQYLVLLGIYYCGVFLQNVASPTEAVWQYINLDCGGLVPQPQTQRTRVEQEK